MGFVYLLLVFLGILLETTLYPLPLGLVGLILLRALGISEKSGKQRKFKIGKIMGDGGGWIFALAGAAGLLLDIWLLRPVGATAGYFAGVLGLLELYSRKMEVSRLRYLIPFTALAVGIYSLYFYGEWILQSGIAIFIVLLAAAVCKYI